MSLIYLLTGATGFLGNNILRILTAQGKKIRVLVLPEDPGKERIASSIDIYTGNILNNYDLEHFFQVPAGSEIIVIHAAGIVSTSWYEDPKVYEVNVEGTRNIVRQCIHSKAKKLIYISSVHALEELPKGKTIIETNKFEAKKIIGFYGKTKAMASQIVTDAFYNENLNANIVFPSGLCGPFDYEIGYVTSVLIDCVKNRLPAGIKGGYDFVDARDVAKGVVSTCEFGIAGEGYILSNRYISVKEILDQVERYSDSRQIKLYLPIWVARGLLPLLATYYKLRKKQALYNRYSLYTLSSNSIFSNRKAKKQLGYRVRPFEETIKDTLTWLEKEGKI